jgi:hypothetical protein
MTIFCKPEFWYTFASILTAFIIFYLSLGLKSEKKYLLRLFRANQTLSLSIQKNLSEFIDKHNSFDSIAFPERNITYGHFLEQMKSEFAENLSEKLFSELKKRKFSKPELTSSIDSLNKQNESLRMVDVDLKLVIRKAEFK